ncbi:hypothetical protein MO867_09525 [Microbulbifer sp. OS29]|uniref:Uncharacterized protein n=1 Tax=Microbulbifer okhotskensis TaxID=2926617 RepID=A0A9X2ELS2_9GAMM|nr:hypothetical protein [Microbulbifer okhotskensis]MCO1334577.1 hypothetical protein [Microbulbifer okhotskensis]
MEKVSLRVWGILGMVLFAPLFLFTFAAPHTIEKSGESFIEWKLKSEADKKIEALRLPAPTKLEGLLGAKAREFRAKTERDLEKVKQQLKTDAPAILATQIAKLRNLDCECRKKWEQSIKVSMQSKLASLEMTKSKLIDFSHVKYMEIVHKLTLDVRIFLAANSIVFIFLLIASFMQPKAIKQLFLPGGLMLISTVMCSYFYLFEQNWLYTIIYNDYTGFAYVGYLSFVFAILCDIVFNRARVTTEVLNTCLQAIGQAGSLVPC